MWKSGQLLIALTWTIILLTVNGSTVLASTATPESEPSSSPTFALVAVGDFPDGYFDDVVVEAGTSVELRVALINTSDIDLDLRVYRTNALNGVNGGFSPGKEDDIPFEWTKWVKFPAAEVMLSPGETKEIRFVVTVPESAEPGQCISSLVAQTAAPEEVPGSEVFDYTMGYSLSVGVLSRGNLSHHLILAPNYGNYRRYTTATDTDQQYGELPGQALRNSQSDYCRR